MQIDSQLFIQRRAELMTQLGQNAIAILPSAQLQSRAFDTKFRFNQSSDFYYLTGFDEPNAVIVLIPGREEGETILFCQAKDPEVEQWTGKRIGPAIAREQFGFSQAFNIDALDLKLPYLLENRHTIYYPIGEQISFDKQVIQWLNLARVNMRKTNNIPTQTQHLSVLTAEMRLFKSDAEIELMRFAADISVGAHRRAMQNTPKLHWEYEVAAEITYEFMRHGCMTPAYESIVASGSNACILHYTQNMDKLNQGDLLLIDAGAEANYYKADITRTFPISGKFSAEQKAVYQIVLEAQKAGIAKMTAGTPWQEVHAATVHVVTEGLVDIGLLKGSVDELIQSNAYFKYYMHGSGHYLGLNVHDVGSYQIDQQSRPLAQRMVCTVEPGIYITPNDKIDPRWWNIGVRIEDDVLVTTNGNEVLSGQLEKEVADIEALMTDG